MPELPEIETIREGMTTKIKGKKIKRVEVRNEKNIKFLCPKEFIGKKVYVLIRD